MFVVINPNVVEGKGETSQWMRKWKRRQKTKSCSGYSWRCQYFHNVNQARRLEAKYKTDEEYRDYFRRYHISTHILNHSSLPNDWWDEKSRRTQGNWKSQYKVNRQYNIHTNAKDSRSIRTCNYEDSFSNENMDWVLEEDFYCLP